MLDTDRPEEMFIDDTMKETLRDVLRKASISPRELYILMGYYDAAHPDRKSEPKNLGQLSAVIGVTPERVRQLKTIALHRIKFKLGSLSVRKSEDISL